MKVFLSHSSKDKEYFVRPIAKRLGKDNIVYDEFTFEAGNKTIDEIYKGISDSDIFVVFISEFSMKSDWVKKEMSIANEKLSEDQLKQIYPILIDNSIDFDSPLIPEWLKKNNLQRVSSPTKAATLIIMKMRELSFLKHPKLAERNELFVGRNKEVEQIEMRIDDYSQNTPTMLIISGLPNIGRKSLMRYSLRKLNYVSNTYPLPIIEMNEYESIEDMILKIEDVTEYGIHLRKNQMSTSIGDKVEVLTEQVLKMEKDNVRIFINDKGAIIGHDGKISEWFQEIINNTRNTGYMFFCIASRFKPFRQVIRENDGVVFEHISELNKTERKSLFKRYLELDELTVSKDDFKEVSSLFSGMPDQIFYATQLIREKSLTYLKNNLHKLVEFNSMRIVDIVKKYEEQSRYKEMISLLTEYNPITQKSFYDILGVVKENYDILDELFSAGICERFGVNNEFIRLNDAIYDYFLRTDITTSKELKQKIANSIVDIKDTGEDYISDIAEYQYTIKTAILDGEIDSISELIIPSHYLLSIKELYDVKRSYKDVIKLADNVLENENFIDRRVRDEIRYYLCISLARSRDKRFLDEVHKISGPNHNYLMGFYYKQVGNFVLAIERYKKALSERYYFSRAQSELVQVYISLEDYKNAFFFAKEGYEKGNKNNPFNSHNYFTCIVNMIDNGDLDKEEFKDTLLVLLEHLNQSTHSKAREMYLRCQSYYYSIIEYDFDSAMDWIDLAITEYPRNIFVEQERFYIGAKFQKHELVSQSFKALEKKINPNRISEQNMLLKLKLVSNTMNNDISRNEYIVSRMRNLPEHVKARLIEKYC